jgi:hypothetical protein
MNFYKAIILFMLAAFSASAQKTEIFFSVQTGNPFRVAIDDENSAPPIWNYSFGMEQYIVDKVSIAVSYRGSFYVSGEEEAIIEKRYSDSQGGFDYTYYEDYDLYAIDIDSKYFFDEPDDDGVYMGSSFSIQHVTAKLEMLQPQPTNYNTGNQTPVMAAGVFEDDLTLFPVGFRLGHRGSTDVVVFDYYMGLTYFLGTGGARRTYDEYLPRYEYKTLAFIIGMKLGFKF